MKNPDYTYRTHDFAEPIGMEPRPDYSGMTVNERLFSAGLLEDWDAAKKSRDRTRMVELLSKVDLADQADKSTILSNRQRYGL